MVFVSAPDTVSHLAGCREVKVVGNPLRKEVMDWKGRRSEAQRELQLEPGRRTILVMGGSRGSEIINQNFLQALRFLEGDAVQVIHLTGKENFMQVQKKTRSLSFPYRVYPFLSCPGIAYAASDLAICRAGANTVFELFFFGLPSILIPYAEATESHQIYNALWLKKYQPVEIVEEHELSPGTLAEKIRKMLVLGDSCSGDTRYLRDAASVIAQEIVENLCKRGEKKD